MRLTTHATTNFPTGKIYLLFLSMVFFAACSDDKTNSPSTTNDTIQKKTNTSNKHLALASLDEFPVLCYDSLQIRNIFNSQPTPFKLVFIFNFNASENYNPTLKFYKARNNGTFFDNPYELTRTTLTFPHDSVVNLGNLELRESILSTIPGKGPHLKFFPRMSTTNPGHITYLLRWGTCEEAVDFANLAGVELNPCPPNQPGQQ